PMTTMLSAADAACSIYGLEITLENQLSALQQHKDAGLELCYVSQWRSHHCSRHVDKEIYIPNDTVTSDGLSAWMSKDGTWGTNIRRQSNRQKRKRGRLLNVVKKVYRGNTWEKYSSYFDWILLGMIFQISLVKSPMATKCTIGYVRKSNTNEPDITKKKLINLQIYKRKTKLLCEDVFVSYNTSLNDPIAERDVTTPLYTFDDCSGNTQDLITKITKSARQIRLVVVDYTGFSTNPGGIRLFISLNKSVREVVVDVGHKVEVYSRYDLLKNIKILNKFQCWRECIKRLR
ncbi:hypothetical protein A0J61_11401, partial [Choanephora cucurbitarum]